MLTFGNVFPYGDAMKVSILLLTVFLMFSACDDDSASNNNNDAGTNNVTNNNNDVPPDFMIHPARVSHVTDGDTVYVWYGNQNYKIRMAGIDTPETFGTPEPFGEEAKQFTIDHLPLASWVGLEFDNEACATQVPPPSSCFDVYDRLLAYLRTLDNQDLGAQLLVNGLAEVYTDANFNRKTQYLQLQNQAISAGVGIWSDK